MTDLSDAELLARFAKNDCEEAFGTLVKRHVNLVYSTASRCTGNPEAAEEVTQAVFILLARKAESLGQKTVLPGWLYQTARMTAANWRRAESRRLSREKEAFLQSDPEQPAPAAIWLELAPLLDEAMGSLGTNDRDALVMRFFRNQTFAEVGEALGIAERAAQKRVTRALEKLRGIFAKRGVAVAGTVIAGAISANSVQAAPAALAGTITAVAGVKGATAGVSTLALAKSASWAMTWAKIKLPALAVVALIATGTSAVLLESEIARARQPSPVKITNLYPININETYDLHRDGSLFFHAQFTVTNSTSKSISSDQFGGGILISKVADEAGQPLNYTPAPNYGFPCSIIFERPVRPGGTTSYSVEGKIPTFAKQGKDGDWGILCRDAESNATELRHTELWLLPKGAVLREKSADMTESVNDGRIELHLDKTIPPSGTVEASLRYSLQ